MTTLSIPLVNPDDDLLSAALKYAAAGWYVGPLSPRDRKNPGSRLGKKWQTKTSDDTETIVEWFTGTDSLLFLHVGRSGAWVADVDDPNLIPDVLTDAIASQSPPHQSSRPEQPGRGHYVFLQPHGRSIGNSTGTLGKAWGEGRGKNGIIVVCPSSHKDEEAGAQYEWLQTGLVPEMTDELAAALPNAGDTGDAATDAEVARFISAHKEARKPAFLKGVLTKFDRDVSDGKSRHEAMVDACCWAARESLVGLYAAGDAFKALTDAFVKAMAVRKKDTDRVLKADPARSEAKGCIAWGIAQAELEGEEKIRERLKDTEPPDPREAPAGERVLHFQTFAELAAEVDNAPPRQWLIRNIWPQGDYGVMSAEPKAQKTWSSLDLAVSVASGTPWLGYKPVDVSGPVMVFVGEGGKGNTVRRIRAIAAAKKVDPNGLQIVVCARAPYLTVRQHLDEMDTKIAELKPALVIIDPLYLAARGANLADLYAMGEVLGNVQAVCQRHSASLLLVHHFNRNTAATGASRNSGAGPQEWARVLMSITVASRKAGELPGETVVITKLDVQGGEVPDQTLRIIRRIWADNPDDLSSPMHVVTLASDEDESEEADTGQGKVTLPPAAAKIVEALADATEPIANDEIVDKIANRHGHGLKRETVSRQLNSLQNRGFVDHEEHKLGLREGKRWFLTDSGLKWQKARSEHVTTCDQPDSGNDLPGDSSTESQNRRSEHVTDVTVTCDDTSERGTCDRVTAPIYRAVTAVTPSQQDRKVAGSRHSAQAESGPVWTGSGRPVALVKKCRDCGSPLPRNAGPGVSQCADCYSEAPF